METREFEWLIQDYTAPKWLSLDSNLDQVAPSPGLHHPTQLCLWRALHQILLHPNLCDVFLSMRALYCVSTKYECLSKIGQNLRHPNVDKQRMHGPLVAARSSAVLPKEALSQGCWHQSSVPTDEIRLWAAAFSAATIQCPCSTCWFGASVKRGG